MTQLFFIERPPLFGISTKTIGDLTEVVSMFFTSNDWHVTSPPIGIFLTLQISSPKVPALSGGNFRQYPLQCKSANSDESGFSDILMYF